MRAALRDTLTPVLEVDWFPTEIVWRTRVVEEALRPNGAWRDVAQALDAFLHERWNQGRDLGYPYWLMISATSMRGSLDRVIWAEEVVPAVSDFMRILYGAGPRLPLSFIEHFAWWMAYDMQNRSAAVDWPAMADDLDVIEKLPHSRIRAVRDQAVR